MREEFLEQTVSNKPQLLCSLCVIYIAIPVEQSLDSFPSTLSADGEGTSIIRSMLFMACILKVSQGINPLHCLSEEP
jgi:hypothetical protein